MFLTHNCDRIDISELLMPVKNITYDLINDGYLTATPPTADSLKIQFDSGGVGEKPATTLAILENIDQFAHQQDLLAQFITIPTEF